MEGEKICPKSGKTLALDEAVLLWGWRSDEPHLYNDVDLYCKEVILSLLHRIRWQSPTNPNHINKGSRH
jgi:hypothetical protein